MTGSRNDSGATRGPNCTRLVWSARYASETMHSSESSSGGSGMVKWSERYNPEKPLASAMATQRLQSGHVNPVWPSTEIDASIIRAPPVVRFLPIVAKGRLSAHYTAKQNSTSSWHSSEEG